MRLYLASALQRLSVEQRWPIATGLVSHAEDSTDHNLPKMLWFAVEPMVAEAPGRALDLVVAGKFPILQNYAARRATQADAHGTVVALLARTADALVQKQLLDGTLDGIGGGGKQIPAPEGWAAVYETLKSAPDQSVVQAAQLLAQRFGDDAATASMLAARPKSGWLLAQAIRSNNIPRTDIPA
ncbi:MAG: hypothetical protein ACKV19_15635 [Verrucomicrobiales bacterium]